MKKCTLIYFSGSDNSVSLAIICCADSAPRWTYSLPWVDWAPIFHKANRRGEMLHRKLIWNEWSSYNSTISDIKKWKR